MPARAGGDGAAAFSFYDHVYLPESIKDLEWEHAGRRYRSQVVFRVHGRRRTTEAYLHERRGDAWVPVTLPDGTRSDGKVETYGMCVEAILGSADTFFTSVFSAQGKRQLSSYRNGEIKSLLADLLGLESIRRQGALAAETARLLKSGVALLRSEQAQSEEALNALRRERGTLQSAANDLQSALQARSDASDRLATAQAQLAQARVQALSEAAMEARRRELREQRDAAATDGQATEQRLDEQGKRERERLQQVERRIATRLRELGSQRAALESRQAQMRSMIREAPRVAWAERRAPVQLRVLEARREHVQAAQARVNGATALQQRSQALQREIAAFQREAGQAALRQADLVKRFGLTAAVPCSGSDLQGRCQLLADANEAKALMPQADERVAAIAVQVKESRQALGEVSSELAGLQGAADARNEAERRLERSCERAQCMQVLAGKAASIAQAQAALASVDAEAAALPGNGETEDEVCERESIASALSALEAQRQLSREHTAAAMKRIADALSALPAPLGSGRVTAAEQEVAAAGKAVSAAEQQHAQAIQRGERSRLIEAQLAAAGMRNASLAARAEAAANALSTWTLLAKCLSNDGVIALDIDDAGPTLAALANDLLLSCYGPRFTVEIRTLVETAKGESREGFDILVHDGESGASKSVTLMSGGERVWVNEALTRAIALYLAQNTGRRFATLFSDEADGPLDLQRKRMFMAMKRAVLRLGGYEREFYVSQTPELARMADAVIDMDCLAASVEGQP